MIDLDDLKQGSNPLMGACFGVFFQDEELV